MSKTEEKGYGNMPINIAIDGPVGAGKSSIAARVAEKLHILHLDTGAMYRAVGLYMLRRGIDPQDERAVREALPGCRVDVRYEAGRQRTLLGGEDVSEFIRTPEVSAATSAISQWPAVREQMVAMQRQIARECDLLMDGRDIGTNVLPQATLKVFLTADPRERARRRYLEMQEKGMPDTYEEVLAALIARDEQDSGRKVNPLRQAEDAVLLDSTRMTLEEVVEAITGMVKGAQA